DGLQVMYREINRDGSPAKQAMDEQARTNTTIGAIVTNASFTKAQLKKIASMARSGFSRAINPVGTMGDGDTIYAFSVEKTVQSDVNLVGTLAAQAMECAIIDAVKSAQISNEEFLKNVE
ncbi:MAG: P1 family peptidase, partial [Bacteroidaceae bacterium]|nr:P1 family peptidase [Bacteroidaceae bacterium]